MQLLIQFVFMVCFCTIANAYDREALWDKIRFKGLQSDKSYSIGMGTGFFVNRNYVITNKHVVDNCKNIAIRGAVEPTLVKLVVVDQDLDLALLYSEAEPKNIPYLRINYDQITKNDVLFTVGYPLKHGETGDVVIKEAQVIDVNKNPNNSFTNISFSDVINHGNSGGPVLDRNSNIAGVVVAKIKYFQDEARSIPSKSVGVAIGLDGVMNFLRKNNIFFAANTTYDIFTNYKIADLIKDYVVNIHCVGDVISEK
ncbi:MAG: hypothetical protein RLZZ59_588 [Pseudomonadota bacterium]|jgi:S1-C subfamily serine protease